MTVGILGMAFKARVATTPARACSYKLQAHPALQGRATCSAPTRTSRSTPTSCRSTTCSREADLLVIGAPHPAYRDLEHRPAGRRHLEPARPRGARVTAPRSRSSSPSTTRATAIVAVPRPHLRGGHAAVRGPRRATTRPTTPRVPYAREVRRRTSRGSSRRSNTYGRGPGARHPLRHRPRRGAESSSSPWPTAATTRMQIDQLARLVERGVVVAAASRYMHGGQQVGGPGSRARSRGSPGCRCYWFARVGTRDATNSFKAYSTRVRARGRHRVATRASRSASSWWPRPAGCACRSPRSPRSGSTARSASRTSSCAAWLPRYLRWYRFAFGPRSSTLEQLATPIEHRRGRHS